MDSFRLLTRDAVLRGRVRAREAAAARKEAAAARKLAAAQRKAAAAPATNTSLMDASLSSLVGPAPAKPPASEEEAVPNRKLVAGMKLPPNLSNYFSVKRLAGRPLEDIDSFYEDKEVSFLPLGTSFADLSSYGCKTWRARGFAQTVLGAS